MRRKNTLRRSLGIILSIVMLISLFEPFAFADGGRVIREKEDNDTTETAQEIDITWEGRFSGQLKDDKFSVDVKDTDVYKFTVPQGTTARFYIYLEPHAVFNSLVLSLEALHRVAGCEISSKPSESYFVIDLGPDDYCLTIGGGYWEYAPEDTDTGIGYVFVFDVFKESDVTYFSPENGIARVDVPLSFDSDTVICGSLKLSDAEEEIIAWSRFSISLKDDHDSVLYEYNMSAKDFYHYSDNRFYSVDDHSFSFPIPEIGLRRGDYHLIAEIQDVHAIPDTYDFETGNAQKYLESYKFCLRLNEYVSHDPEYYPNHDAEPNDQSQIASSIIGTAITTGTFSDAADKDWFTFDCPESGYYSANLWYDYEPEEEEEEENYGNTDGLNCDFIFTVYDQDLEPVGKLRSHLDDNDSRYMFMYQPTVFKDNDNVFSDPAIGVDLEKGKTYYISFELADTEGLSAYELNSLTYFFSLFRREKKKDKKQLFLNAFEDSVDSGILPPLTENAGEVTISGAGRSDVSDAAVCEGDLTGTYILQFLGCDTDYEDPDPFSITLDSALMTALYMVRSPEYTPQDPSWEVRVKLFFFDPLGTVRTSDSYVIDNIDLDAVEASGSDLRRYIELLNKDIWYTQPIDGDKPSAIVSEKFIEYSTYNRSHYFVAEDNTYERVPDYLDTYYYGTISPDPDGKPTGTVKAGWGTVDLAGDRSGWGDPDYAVYYAITEHLYPFDGSGFKAHGQLAEEASFMITSEQDEDGHIRIRAAANNTGNDTPEDDIVDSGTFAGATWTLTKDGTLTFSGPTGMKYMVECVDNPDSADDYSTGWTKYADEIKKIVMENGFSTVYEGYYSTSAYSLFFDDLPNLEAFEVSKNNENIKSESGVLYTKDGKCLIQYPVGRAGTEFSVPDTVTELADHAFESAPLSKIVLPEGIKEISDSAFEDCVSLSDINIPQSVKSIGSYAFNNCSSFKSVELPNGLEDIGACAFSESGVSEIIIPDGVTSIGDSAFQKCPGLKKAILSNNLEEIPFSAFRNCELLSEITIPGKVRKIRGSAFEGCNSLNAVNIPTSVEYVGADVFSGTPLLQNAEKADGVIYHDGWIIGANANALPEKLVIRDDTFGIAYGTFRSADKLLSVIIPDSVAFICDYAFEKCENLTSVKMPSGLKTIGYEAFCDDISIIKMTIPVGVATIGARAFFGCDSLRDFVVYGNPEIEYDAFAVYEGDDYYDLPIDGFLLKCLKDSSAHKYAVENNIKVELLDESDMLSRAQKLRQAFDKDGKKVVQGNLAYMIRRHGEKQEYTDNYKTSDLGVKTLVYTDTDIDGEDELLAFEIVGDDETHVLQLKITGYDIDENGKILTAAYEPKQFNNQHALYEMEGERENFIGVENGYIVLLSHFGYDSQDFSYFTLRFENGEFKEEDLFTAYAEGAGTENECIVRLSANEGLHPAQNEDSKLAAGIIGSEEIREQIAALKEKTRETLPELTLFPIDDNGKPRIYDENGEWDWSRASLSAESVLVLSNGYENKEITFKPIDADLGGIVFAPVDRTNTFVTYNTVYGDILLGDVTSVRNTNAGDGKILASDARLVLRASASLEQLNFAQKLAADVNRDGSVYADDARQILRYSAKLEDMFTTSPAE